MTCRLDDQWAYRGLRCIRLENEHLAVDVLPELGGNIYRFVDKARDHDLLWKSPRVQPHRVSFTRTALVAAFMSIGATRAMLREAAPCRRP